MMPGGRTVLYACHGWYGLFVTVGGRGFLLWLFVTVGVRGFLLWLFVTVGVRVSYLWPFSVTGLFAVDF